MADPFTVLGLPRRPLLTEEEIGIAYRKLAGETHPDQSGGDADSFRTLGEAASVLRDPARRLRVLAGVTAQQPIPERAAEFFPRVAEQLQQADALQTRFQSASSPLAKAVLNAPLKTLVADLQNTLQSLEQWKDQLNEKLGEADQLWPSHDPAFLLQLADSFAYAGRWQAQLRERKLALETFLV